MVDLKYIRKIYQNVSINARDIISKKESIPNHVVEIDVYAIMKIWETTANFKDKE